MKSQNAMADKETMPERERQRGGQTVCERERKRGTVYSVCNI